MDIQGLGNLFNEWFQIVKKYDPIAEDSKDYWDCMYSELSLWSEKHRDADEPTRWIIVRLVEVLMYYEDVKLNGVKDKRECRLEDYLRKRLKCK